MKAINHFILFALVSCNSSSSTVITNEVPNPSPIKEYIQLLDEATPNNAYLSFTDSLNTSFMTIGLGNGIGRYEILFFLDTLQKDTITPLNDVNYFINNISLRQPVTAKFSLRDTVFDSSKWYYWVVWYKPRNVKSQLRKFYLR